MTTAEDYISQVLRYMPAATPSRPQIAMELRGHIAERLTAGQPLADVLGQLGDPMALAESYLGAVPFVSPSHLRRAAAKLVDVLIVATAIVPAAWVAWRAESPFIALGVIVGGSFLFGIYTVLAEYLAGQTLGKHLLGLRVVRDSGARIGLGQAVVRQLPMFLEIFLIDALFALFTAKRQRAFELLSNTRVIGD